MCCDRINSSQALVSHGVEWGKRYLLSAQSTKNTLLIFPPYFFTSYFSQQICYLMRTPDLCPAWLSHATQQGS